MAHQRHRIPRFGHRLLYQMSIRCVDLLHSSTRLRLLSPQKIVSTERANVESKLSSDLHTILSSDRKAGTGRLHALLYHWHSPILVKITCGSQFHLAGTVRLPTSPILRNINDQKVSIATHQHGSWSKKTHRGMHQTCTGKLTP